MAFLSRWPQIPRCTDLAGKEASAGRAKVPGPLPRWCLMLAGEPGVWPVDRLTDEDQCMLWPDAIWPQEIGALAVLDGGLAGPGGRVRVEVVREVIAVRLRLVPRFRQLLYVPRPGLGRPLWVDAPAFYGVHGATAVVLLATAALLFT